MTPCIADKSSFATTIEIVPDYVYRNLFQQVLLRSCFNIIYKSCVPFYHNIFQKVVCVRQKQF